ncbi:MAG: GAF domain-containing protein [bacterium]|nr:GAF domain-containing protein [bacterium]
MTAPHDLADTLNALHKESGADQSAVYYFAYPAFKNLFFCAKAERVATPERYWRAQCTDAETIRRIRDAKEPLLLSAETISEGGERMWAAPILSGVNVIGVVVHCFVGYGEPEPERVQRLVNERSRELFSHWVEFLVAEQSRPLSVLFKIAGSISSSLDLDRVLINVVEQATLLFRAKMSSVMLLDKKNNELEMVTAYGCSLEYLDKPNLPIEGTALGRAVKERRIVVLENVFEEDEYIHKDLARHEGVSSLMAAPIMFQENVLGVLNIYSSTPRRWQRSEQELLQTFANHTAIAITNARVHEQVISMEEQIQVSSRLATLGELAAGLAHEIRNPLAVINMLIHSWKAAPPAQEDFDHDVNVIVQKISDLNSLITDLLNLAVSRPLERIPVNVGEVIDRVLRLLRHRITQQRVNLRTNFDARSIIHADRERVEQAVLNLMLNALDVTPEGGTIGVYTWEDGDNLFIEIADSGPGIPEDKMALLFKPFQTSKKKGFGLGLPITKRIVEEHKGEIVVSAIDPHGARFTMSLPFNPDR